MSEKRIAGTVGRGVQESLAQHFTRDELRDNCARCASAAFRKLRKAGVQVSWQDLRKVYWQAWGLEAPDTVNEDEAEWHCALAAGLIPAF